MKINITSNDFGTLCICAIRYCHGRQSYMPRLVQEIVGNYLDNISDNNLRVMLNDCDFQKEFNLYGNEKIDKPNWMRWKEKLEKELKRRQCEIWFAEEEHFLPGDYYCADAERKEE